MDRLLLGFESVPLVLIGICLLLLLLQLYFLLFVHGKLALHKIRDRESLPPGDQLPPLSVVICTRNEEHHLAENLTTLLEQDYPSFEVIVVNDRSDDDTKWLLKDLAEQHPRLKVVEIAEHVLSQSGKKFGVAMGIKAAEHEHVVFTDANCRPSSRYWLQHIGAAFESGRKIILGYVPLPSKNGFASALIRFGHFWRSVNYLSYALRGNAYMGLGQNMAYEKSLFFEGKGFASHIHVRSGYDELFVNQHASRRNTAISIHKEAHVWKPMPASLSEHLTERKFRQQAVALYRPRHRRMLRIQAISAVFFYLALIGTVIVEPATWPFVVGIYLFRLIAQYIIYIPIAKKLRITRMLWYLPVMDVLHRFYYRS